MRSSLFFTILSLFAVILMSAHEPTPRPLDEPVAMPRRPVSTYSIVARDPDTGELGVAVQSHWFSVGPVVPWAEAGVGAVATQSFADPSYGPLGLSLMRAGRSAEEALAGLLRADAGRELRQVAMVDARGRVAAHTGARCIAEASHLLGEQFSVQANLMDRSTVPQAMADAFRAAQGDLAARLVAALHAAEAEGGDVRGKQSSALLVVPAEGSGRPWADKRFELRVEDHPEPVVELERLLLLARSYEAMQRGDEAVEAGDLDAAMRHFEDALEFAPDAATQGEAPFWVGVTLAATGREAEARPFLLRAAKHGDNWARVLPRLPPSGLLPDDPELITRMQAVLREG